MTLTAIIPAAGTGSRMGAAKQYMELAGKPLLDWTLSAISDSDWVDGIILVVPSGDAEKIREKYLDSPFFKKVRSVVAGGATRADSVHNGVAAAVTDYVLIHDAARPFVSRELLAKTVAAARLHGAATAATLVRDTVKVREGEMLGGLADRDSLLLIQTPQVFKRADLLAAYEIVGARRRDLTDETTLVQAAGYGVAWVEGEATNMKVTTPDDLRLAELIASYMTGL
ncbi:MAG: 2-C-methyl-D-erythritol 4-phosphate cytidylyltransferase [Nitrospinae bacterium]|nr:2-C-methyl-D-erythritol 4-phosphate cytidylyltransferase [Nitrospinota bacterium]